MIPELEPFAPDPDLKRYRLAYQKSYRIPLNYGHGMFWLDADGQQCESILTAHHFTEKGKRKARLVQSDFLFSTTASHYYISIAASAPFIQIGNTIHELAGYGPERDALEDFLGPINIQAERRLTKFEKDLNGNPIGKIGDWTSRFNSNAEARQAAIRTFRDRFASGWEQVADYRCPIEVGQVTVQPGDLIFGDLDGVVVIPKKVEAEVIERALAKARGEKLVRKEIEAGMSSTAAFKKYGIL